MNHDKSAVLITGAGSGIGEATARLFSENGYPVILTGRRREVLEGVAGSLKGKTYVIPADLHKLSDVEKLVKEALSQAGAIDTLINNAGAYERREFVASSDELWQELWDINTLGPVRLIRALLPHFLEQNSASIVNVASTAGLRPISGASAYVVSKAALISLSQTLALELAPKGIRVNCVCPGVVETPIHRTDKLEAGARKELMKIWGNMHPLGRAGKPEDVAWAIYQLCDPRSDWMTGAVLAVDGGISLT